jgi:hypothetical protein
VFRFLHVHEVNGKMDDTRHVRITKFDPTSIGESVVH